MAISDVDLWYHDLSHDGHSKRRKIKSNTYKMKSFIKIF